MRIAILQPNYVSWRGYFDFFKQSDVFVFYDDVQYTRRDWRNRNIIKTPDGGQWLTIPVNDVDRNALIKDVDIIYNGWEERHLNMLEQNYRNSPYFNEMYDLMKESFCEKHVKLCDLNISITKKINEFLGLNRCKTFKSSEIGYLELSSTDRLVAICQHLKATEYLSGDAAKDYLEIDKFGNINVLWHRYKEKVYPQLHSDFLSRVSIIDTIMNVGIRARDII